MIWDPWTGSDVESAYEAGDNDDAGARLVQRRPAPGKVTLTQHIPPRVSREAQIERTPSGNAPAEAPIAPLERAARSNGFPLPEDTSDYLGAALGTNLSGVRVHTDAPANSAADAYQARAFTHGRDIYFARGEYEPGSASGRRLLYHEVVHTEQQGDAAAAPQRKMRVSQPGDANEHEADQLADALVAGEPAPRVKGHSAGLILREPSPDARVQSGDSTPGETSADDTWNRHIGEASTPVGKFARVKVPKGLRLRTEPHAGAETKAIMPFDTLVRVERRTCHGWAYVIALGDARDGDTVTGEGFCEYDFLMLDPPETGAHLHYVRGEIPKDIAARHYKGAGFDRGSNARLFVEAIWQANSGRTEGVYRRQDADLSWKDTALRGERA